MLIMCSVTGKKTNLLICKVESGEITEDEIYIYILKSTVNS
jgi:hypothetical protein